MDKLERLQAQARLLTRRDFLRLTAAGLAVMAGGPLLAACGRPSASPETPDQERWASSENLNITINSPTGPVKKLTSSLSDFKPSWSPDGTMLTFFRVYAYGSDFKDWRSKTCVINADGTGFRELTSGDYPDFNPTWTRDGSQRIIFNRFSTTRGGYNNRVYWTSPSDSAGEEQLISDPDYAYYEWANSGLRDGRIFVDRGSSATAEKSYLLTPRPGERGDYQEIERPTPLLWHKLSVSPSETKVAYMLDNDYNIPTYSDSVICYAEFDVEALKIHNQVQITEDSPSSIEEYPAWNKDESLLVYDSNRAGTYQVYAYRLADGTTTRLSPDESHSYQFADFENLPK